MRPGIRSCVRACVRIVVLDDHNSNKTDKNQENIFWWLPGRFGRILKKLSKNKFADYKIRSLSLPPVQQWGRTLTLKKMTKEQSKLINDLKEARELISGIMTQLEDSVLIDDENPFGIVQEDSIEEKLLIADQYLRTVLNQVEPNPYL